MNEEKKFNTIRLNSSHTYNRPSKTITDSLQDPIKFREKLKGYKEVDDIDSVSISTHVRYFIYDKTDNKWKFRTGGLLAKKHAKYVILSNNKYSWSVQKEVSSEKGLSSIDDNESSEVFETKFFKILSKEEKNEEEIEQLKMDNAKMAHQLKILLNNRS